MPRFTDASLKAALAATPSRLAWLINIARTDGTSLNLTSHERDLVVGGVTWAADAGFVLNTLSAGTSEVVGSAEIEINWSATSAFQPDDVIAGLYANARVTVRVCDWSQTGLGSAIYQVGYVETFENTDREAFRLSIKGLLNKGRQVFTEVYTPTCRADLGDARCRLPLYPDTNLTEVERSTAYALGQYVRKAQSGAWDDRIYQCSVAGTTDAGNVSYSRTVGDTITDGSAQFKCEQAWSRLATVTAATDAYNFAVSVTEARAVNGWFSLGQVVWLTGANAGRIDQIGTWTQSGGLVKLLRPVAFDVEVGDTAMLLPGCDKRRSTCADKFANFLKPLAFFDATASAVNTANGLNFVGEPDAVSPNQLNATYGGL